MPRRTASRRKHLSSFWEDIQSKAKKAGEVLRDTAGNVKSLSSEFAKVSSYADGLKDDLKSRGADACRKAFVDVVNINSRVVEASAKMNLIGRRVQELKDSKKKADSATQDAFDTFEKVCVVRGGR